MWAARYSVAVEHLVEGGPADPGEFRCPFLLHAVRDSGLDRRREFRADVLDRLAGPGALTPESGEAFLRLKHATTLHAGP